jgi:hypothetical protein
MDDIRKVAEEAGISEKEMLSLNDPDQPQIPEEEETPDEAPGGDEGNDEPPAEVKAPDEEAQAKPAKKKSIREEMVEYRNSLKAEREARERDKKEFEDRANKEAERYKLMIEAIKSQNAPKDEGPKEPSLEDAPLDYVLHEINQIKTSQQNLGQMSEQERRIRHHNDLLQQDLTYFVPKHPDYEEAMRHLTDHLSGLYEDAGIADQNQRIAMVAEQIRGTTANAYANNRSACETIYKMAKRVGFGGGQPAPTNGKTEITADDLKRINAGQTEATGAPGGSDAASGELTIAKLSDMPPNELHKLVESKFGGDMEACLAAAKW